jgi:hypothetical protein
MLSPDERDATPFVDGQSHCLANNAADAIITLSAVYALEMAASYHAVAMKTRQPSRVDLPARTKPRSADERRRERRVNEESAS